MMENEPIGQIPKDKGREVTGPSSPIGEAYDEPEPIFATEGNVPPLVDPDASTATLPPPDPQQLTGAHPSLRGADLIDIGAMLFQEAESLLQQGRKRRLRVRLGRKTLAEIPLTTMGAIGVFASVIAAVAVTRLVVDVE